MNPIKSSAVTRLNQGIQQLQQGHFNQGRNTVQSVISYLSSMNLYYENNHMIRADGKGGKKFTHPSVAYHYSWNKRDMEKLNECVRLLDESEKNVPLVIQVLLGEREILVSSKQ